MSNFTLTRDDFIKLGRVEEWDKYKDDNERTMYFFCLGVTLTSNELSIIGHEKDYKVILNENLKRVARDGGKPLTPELKRMYKLRGFVEYYPPEECVARAIFGFCNSLTELIAKYTLKIKDKYKIDLDPEGYDSVISMAKYTCFVLDRETWFVGSMFENLFFFHDKLVEFESDLEDLVLKENVEGSVPIPISGEMFASIAFVCNQAIDVYKDKVREKRHDRRDNKIGLKKTNKPIWANKDKKSYLRNIFYKTIRDRESDHGSSPEEFTQIMAWHLARAVLNGEMDFAKHLAKNIDILERISKKYGLKYEELKDEAENERVKFYAKQNPNLPEYKYKLSLKTFQKYEKRSEEPISSATEAAERKKWFFSEIPLRNNSPLRFVELLNQHLNRKYRKK